MRIFKLPGFWNLDIDTMILDSMCRGRLLNDFERSYDYVDVFGLFLGIRLEERCQNKVSQIVRNNKIPDILNAHFGGDICIEKSHLISGCGANRYFAFLRHLDI